MRLKDRKAVVTGGSRGLGLGLVEALVEAGAEVTVVARGTADLTAVRDRLGVATIAADVTDADAARTILAEVRPEVLALIAGAPPPMGPLHELSWADFTAVWDTDVKAGLYWMQAALKTPLAPGSRILVGSSGAALNGSPLSGGYAGAKRMLWIMADYANGISNELDLGLQFQVLVPRADGRRHRGGSGRVRGLRPANGRDARSLPCPLRRADAAAAVRGPRGVPADRAAICRRRRLRPEGRHRHHASGRGRRLNGSGPSATKFDRDAFPALSDELRPELHRYCARLTGSVFDGEDVVQDTLARAFAALQDLDELPPLRPWLFRIAHNRAIDLLRGRALRAADPIDAAVQQLPDVGAPGAEETLMRQEAVRTAVSRFVELPTTQRSAVILKDVLDHSLAEIAALLDLSIDAVKAHLARGRANLREINARAADPAPARPASAAAVRYAALFNARDWDGLRALLADDVRLNLSSKPLRVGAADVGVYFTVYGRMNDVRLVPAWAEGREVFAVFAGSDAERPSYLMLIEWRGEQISFIRDYHYARYVVESAAIELAAPSRSP